MNENPVNLQCVMSQQLEEHFKLGVQACLKGFVKDANIQGNIVISKYLLKIDVCCNTWRIYFKLSSYYLIPKEVLI